jgi:hypothetical protein
VSPSRAAASPPVVILVVASTHCRLLSVHVSHTCSSSVVRVLHRLQAPPSRYSGAVDDLLPMHHGSPQQQLQEPRSVVTPTSSPSSSTTLLPASSSHPRLLRLLRSDNRELRRHSRHTAPQSSSRSSLLVLQMLTLGWGLLPSMCGTTVLATLTCAFVYDVFPSLANLEHVSSAAV